MPTYYTTGRTRTITLSGNLSGPLEMHRHSATISESPPHTRPDFEIYWLENPNTTTTSYVQGYGCDVVGTGGVLSPNGDAFGGVTGSASRPIYYRLLARTCLGTSSSTIYTLKTLTGADPDYTANLSGTYSLSADVEEVFWIIDDGFAPTFPLVGTHLNDSPTSYKIYFGERLRDGGNVTSTVTALGNTVTATTTITVGNQFILDETAYRTRRLFSCWSLGTGAASCSVTATCIGQSISSGYSRSGTHVDWTSTASDGSVALTTLEDTTSYGSYVDCKLAPTKAYSLNGVCRAMEDAFPTTLTYYIDRYKKTVYAPDTITGSGTFSDSYSQRWYSVFSKMGGTAFNWTAASSDTPITADEWQDFRIWLKPDSLTSSGDDSRDWRVGVKGQPFTTQTLTQASSGYVHNSVWTGVGAADMTLSLPSASTDAGLKGTSFTGASLAGYRYLRLRVKSSVANKTFTVKIGTKQWTADYAGVSLSAGVAYANFDIDLCSPTNATASTDGVDTRWPLPTVDGTYYGVTSVSSLVLTGLVAGITYDVESVQVVRHSYANMTFGAAFENWINSGAIADYRARFMLGDTDGRQSFEFTDFSRTLIAGVYSYGASSLTTLVDQINGNTGAYPTDGWTATASGSFPADGWNSNSLPSTFIYGNGTLYDGSWSYGFDKSCTGTLSIKAQANYDYVGWYPECGDLFQYSAGAYGGAADFRSGKVLRGQAIGIVVKNNSLPADSVAVYVNSSTDGQGTTGSDGAYQTGTPYPKGNTSKAVSPQTGPTPYPSLTTAFSNRKRSAARFRVQTAAGKVNPFNIEGYLGQYHRVGIQSKKIYYYQSDYTVPLPGWRVNGVLVDDPGANTNADPRMGINHFDRLILLFSRLAGAAYNVYETYSDDDGATWSSPTLAIASGKHPTIAVGINGDVLRAAYVGAAGGPGVINATWQGVGETSQTSFTFKDDAGANIVAEDDTFHVAQATDGQARWLLAIVIDGETDTSDWQSWDDCRTWVRI